MKHFRQTAAPVLVLLMLMLTTGPARADGLHVTVSPGDRAMAGRATHGLAHVLPRNDTQTDAQASPNAVTRYNDLIDRGGPVATAIQSHNIYVNAPSTTWGNPAQFTTDYGASTFVGVLNQYMPAGVTGAGRYVTGAAVSATIPVPTQPLQDPADIAPIVHAAAVAVGGVGYGHVYHVFLPPNYDECASFGCYGGPSGIFCAYHSSYDFPDIGHVLFTVEPYQAVVGCMIAGSGPNGVVADSTDNSLSHELAETITDPDPPSGWVDSRGREIADKCVGVYAVVLLNRHSYKIQKLYSNKIHACSTGP